MVHGADDARVEAVVVSGLLCRRRGCGKPALGPIALPAAATAAAEMRKQRSEQRGCWHCRLGANGTRNVGAADEDVGNMRQARAHYVAAAAEQLGGCGVREAVHHVGDCGGPRRTAHGGGVNGRLRPHVQHLVQLAHRRGTGVDELADAPDHIVDRVRLMTLVGIGLGDIGKKNEKGGWRGQNAYLEGRGDGVELVVLDKNNSRFQVFRA